MKPYVEVQEVTKWYPVKNTGLLPGRKKYVKAVNNVSLDIFKGEILGIIGESGCGKSTLGRILTRLEDPTSGDVTIDGASTATLIKEDFRAFRRLVQIIFQNPYDSFTPRDTIGEILMRPMRLHKIGANKNERFERALKALQDGGLTPAKDFLSRYPHQLSGGQLQRISIIRAMLLEPTVIIADEPVSMLDVSVRADIINMLLRLKEEKGATVIFISHDISLTRYISDRIAVMYLGRIVESGTADALIHRPAHPYTKALISNCASIDPQEEMQKIQITGEPPTPIDQPDACYFAPRCPWAKEACLKAYPPLETLEEDRLVACYRARELRTLSEQQKTPCCQ